MNILFVDCSSWAKKFNVGDAFSIDYSGTRQQIPDIEHKKFKVHGDNIEVTLENGNWYTSWNLSCQSVFLIVDQDAGKVIFTSKDYSDTEREDSSCPFYDELRKLIESNFKVDDGLYDVVDEFDDI